ncbi:Ubiquitin carboxyl-terminal hydrolase 32 [Phytophthora boehmeriae]|uniref:ubiquitinyl hydrolase 1 n=1 Tax=Phytophthora boehmeriae TaxID=109152 RepID=A0A8T1WRF9_9STRA|nr:Ubiquitin carboxyl-terminal hydrolase 32 [Phytophthora boehmeriae]
MPSANKVLPLAAEETVAIDWDIRTLKEEYDPIQASKLDFDASVQLHQRQDNQPLNLAHCMEMFTAKETIPEAYCGHCKTLRPATKKMDLWRLPPLLVIQLKRFCFTQVSRRKLHHLVDFPLKGLQLDDFVARQREPRRGKLSGLEYWLFLGGKLKSVQDETKSSSSSPSSDNLESSVNDSDNSSPFKPVSPRRQSSALLDAPATAASSVRADDGFLYDLYAVVNHVGALGGGHYFAYVLSEHDGKWKCFNDHQCKDIDEKEVVSTMAYILFYRRRDTAQYTIEQLFPPLPVDATGNGSSTEEEAASDKAQVEELLEQSKAATSGSASSCIIS